jgi:hypothetical protein
MPGDVIEHGLDNVWLHAKLSHARGNGASQIVYCPVGQGGALIKQLLAAGPTPKANIVTAEYTVPVLVL